MSSLWKGFPSLKMNYIRYGFRFCPILWFGNVFFCQNLLHLVNGVVMNEKIGGILAIRELIDCTSAAAEAKIIKFARTLSHAINVSTDYKLTELIADAFGHMAKNSPVSHRDYLEGELNRSLDWLRGKNTPYKRFAACMILQQLATNAPTIFFAKINEFFDLIWSPLWDTKEIIRIVAGQALSACLAVLKERTYHLQWYCFIYDQLQEGFQGNSGEELVHGSLLVVTEMLRFTGDFMIPRFKEVCKSLMLLKDHRSRIVKSAIIELLPALASLCPDVFARAHMDESLDFLLRCTKVNELRASALLSTGKMCKSMGPHLLSRVDEMVSILREVFIAAAQSKRHFKAATEIIPEAMMCVSDMVQGLGTPFHARIHLLVEPMIQTGLSQELIDTLTIISNLIPGLRSTIQGRLMEEVCKVLGGNTLSPSLEPDYTYSWVRVGERAPRAAFPPPHVPEGRLQSHSSMRSLQSSTSMSNFAHAGLAGRAMPSRGGMPAAGTVNGPAISHPIPSKPVKQKKGFASFFSRSSTKSTHAQAAPTVQTSIGPVAVSNTAGLAASELASLDGDGSITKLVILSLRTLSSLAMEQFNTITMMQQSVLPYLLSDHYLIRKEAAVTAAKMTGQLISLRILKGPTAQVIEETITRLLEVAVSDTATVTRLEILRSFNGDFDKYLARPHHLDTLMLLWADEMFEIRLEALNVLGRMASCNPAVVLPAIRTQLMRLISEMISVPDYRALEEAASMLCRFLKFSRFHFLVRPVVSKIFDCLPLHGDVRATTAALETVGELATVLQTELMPYTDMVLPIVISNMFDSSSLRKQEVAIKTLGQLVRSTGLVVRPYLQYPQLLPKTLDLLCRGSINQPYSFRLEILRTLGLMGALEPFRYNAILSFLSKLNDDSRGKGGDDFYDRKAIAGIALAGSSMPLNMHSGSVDHRDREAKVAFAKDLPTGGRSDKERSESNVSMVDRAAQLTRTQETDWTRNVGGDRKSVNGLSEEAVVQTDKLLFGDSADAPSYLFMYEQSFMRSISEPAQDIATVGAKFSPASEEFYPRVALTALLGILQDQTLSVHHGTATQTIIQIFNGLGVKCVPFLAEIVPIFLQIVRRSGSGLRESVLQQLSELVAIAGQFVTPYLPQILDILRDYWDEHLEFVLAIVQQVAITTADSFEEYLEKLLPLILTSLELPRDVVFTGSKFDQSVLRPLEEVLSCVMMLQIPLRPHLHLFIPRLCSLVQQLSDLGVDTLSVQIKVVSTIKLLISFSNGAVAEQSNHIASTLVHTLCRLISSRSSNASSGGSSELSRECSEALIILAQQIGRQILTFDHLIQRTLEGENLDVSLFRELIGSIRSGVFVDYDNYASDLSPIALRASMGVIGDDNSPTLMATRHAGNNSPPPIQKHILNQHQLAKAWDVSQRSTANDWHEWLWRFNVDLLRESPSPTLRACAPLAQNYPPMAKELFHAAFVSCWHELSEQYQDSLVRALQTAFKSTTIPSEILQYLLNLAEFMEHDVEALPISLSILAELAQKGHAYAKALHYRELEFGSNPAACFETLININKKLDQYEAAAGLLKVATQIQKKLPEFSDFYAVQESWLAKLGYWPEALAKYEEKLMDNPRDSVAIAGKMKCLEALGRWEEAVKLCEENLDYMRVEHEAQQKSNAYVKAAVIGARAAWSLNEWTMMDNFVSHLPQENVDGSFMKAVLAVYSENFDETQKYLEVTRRHLDKSITSLMSESYGRAYMPLIMTQQCSELEEIMEYKMFLKESGLSEQSDLSAAPPLMKTSFASDRHRDEVSSTLSAMEDFGGVPHRPHRHVTMSMLLWTDNAMERAGSDVSTSQNQQIMREEAQRRKLMLTEKWRRRIRGCASSGRAAIPYWKYLLNGRRMILTEREDLDTWLDFVSLCRNGGNSALAERVLTLSDWTALNTSTSSDEAIAFTSNRSAFAPLPDDAAISMERRIKFAMLKQKWSTGRKVDALQDLEQLVKSTRLTSTGSLESSYLSCLLKLGEWKIAIIDPGRAVDLATRMDVLSLFSRATAIDPNSYRATHQWGLSNYRAVEELRASMLDKSGIANTELNISAMRGRLIKPSSVVSPTVPKDQMVSFITNAIKGLMRAIALGTRRFSSSVMQDMLCILSLWFKHGKIPEVLSVIEQGLSYVPLENWLGVLPQLIARIDHPDKSTRVLLHNLLMRLGTKHPQALVYPLSVASKSPRGDRKEAADTLLNNLSQHSTKLIEQAQMVSAELVRVAILWEELWHWVLEDASRLCFGDGNMLGMLELLEPLHETLEKGPATLREAAFVDAYKNDLSQAWDLLKHYKRTMAERGQVIPQGGHVLQAATRLEDSFISQAWEIYYTIFKRINGQINLIHSLELQYTSPLLAAAKDLELGVPGTYLVSGQAVRIQSFHGIVAIIRSKQRPRKIRIRGEDGQDFGFLLKGHEDLRQDERAMQLFGLVNALLYHDRRTGANSDDLQIQRYAIMPLSPSVGLIGWVPGCDTLHDLIRAYRDSRKIMLDVEHRLIMQAAPGKLYDFLPVMHKLEVFEFAISYTSGEDLARILWLKSENSESWLQRRACYTRSLAVMSMVGYILGLGDRHPSNLMLDKQSGKVLHIDFGDCFEVAMHREKFPEKVPFRLTRMLVSAMEVAGIEGNFRATCEQVMAVLRENRDSLLATLEAFVYDPLISWRLMNIKPRQVAAAAATPTSTATSVEPAPVILPTSTATTHIDLTVGASVAEGFDGGADDPSTDQSIPAVLVPVVARPSVARSITFVKRLEPIEESNYADPFGDREHDENEEELVVGRSLVISQSLLTEKVLRAPATAEQATPNFVNPMDTILILPPSASQQGQQLAVSMGQDHSASRRGLMSAPNAIISDFAAAMNASTGANAVGAKSVSFSHTNLTIDSDNNIRNSSVAVPAPEKNPVYRPAVIAANAGTSSSAAVHASLHLEIASLSNTNSTAIAQQGRMMSASARQQGGFSLLSSVRSSVVEKSGATTAIQDQQQDELSEKALLVLKRVHDKLTGLDFPAARAKSSAGGGSPHVNLQQHVALGVAEQVDRLIQEATSNENLSQSFFGWCPFW